MSVANLYAVPTTSGLRWKWVYAASDAAETDAATTASGNVLANDLGTSVSQVAGSAANVGVAVAGSGGGVFTIAADGAWTFDPAGDFALLTGTETAETSVTYYVSDGVAEAMATLTVTVSSAFVSKLWTPADITTALWLDAADASTITLNESAVSQWSDKSGNARHAAQGTAGAQPTRGANVVTFDGGDYFRFPGSNASDYALKFGTGSFAILCVVNPTAVNRNPHIIFGARGFDAGWFFGLSNNNPYMRMYNKGERWSPSPATGVTLATGLQMLGATAPRGATGRFYRNGNIVVSTSAVVGSSSMANSRYVHVGGYTDNSDNPTGLWLGGIHEIIVFPGVMSVDDWQKAEGYMAHRWDAMLGVTTLVDALPSDHPYKSAAPTV